MKFKEFGYQVEAEVEFTRDELVQLQELAKRHYDGRCKAAAEQGGLIYGMINLLFDHPVGDITMTNDKIDLLCKIAEGENGFVQLGGRPYLGDLGKKLADIHRKMNEESKRINSIPSWIEA